MPYRKLVFSVGEIYHTFNRGVASQPIFHNSREYGRALQLIEYYRFSHPPLRFSHYNRLPAEEKIRFIENLRAKEKYLVEILTFCLMPNHFHFLLRELEKDGVSTFMRNFQNSYTHYFNTKHKRVGAGVQSPFKAVRIENDEQLIHVSRYIHLNPVTAYLIEINELDNYPWSSFREYLTPQSKKLSNPEIILSNFRTPKDYKEFVVNQADYQRELGNIKHLILENE